MCNTKYIVLQGAIERSSHYSDIKMKSMSNHQFCNAFFDKSGNIVLKFEGIATQKTILWHDIIKTSRSIMLFGYPFDQGCSFTQLFSENATTACASHPAAVCIWLFWWFKGVLNIIYQVPTGMSGHCCCRIDAVKESHRLVIESFSGIVIQD